MGSFSSFKYQTTIKILDEVGGNELLKRTLIHTYLVDAFDKCSTARDMEMFLPNGLFRDLGWEISSLTEVSLSTLSPEEVIQIKDRHPEAFGFLQEFMLLRMLEG